MFEAWEADFGRTYFLGDDAIKKNIRDSLEPIWKKVKAHFDENPEIKGDELYNIACGESSEAGWEFGGVHTGELIDHSPHERIPKDK